MGNKTHPDRLALESTYHKYSEYVVAREEFERDKVEFKRQEKEQKLTQYETAKASLTDYLHTASDEQIKPLDGRE